MHPQSLAFSDAVKNHDGSLHADGDGVSRGLTRARHDKTSTTDRKHDNIWVLY